MKAVILANEPGTYLASECVPRAMVSIGERPAIWHAMSYCARFGINDFIVCLGYAGYAIKEYFFNYRLHVSDVVLDLSKGVVHLHQPPIEDWRITLIDAGAHAGAGACVKRALRFLEGDTAFCLMQGDCFSNVDLGDMAARHKQTGALATVAAVRASRRRSTLKTDASMIVDATDNYPRHFEWSDAGIAILSSDAADEVPDGESRSEMAFLSRIARTGRARAFYHEGFYVRLETPDDRDYLQDLWRTGRAPWAEAKAAIA